MRMPLVLLTDMLRPQISSRLTVLLKREQRFLVHGASRWQGTTRVPPAGGALYHTVAGPELLTRRDEDDKRKDAIRLKALPRIQIATFHSSVPNERAAAIALALGTLSAASFAGAQAIKAYNEWKASQPEIQPEAEEDSNAEESAGAQGGQKQEESEGPRENIFAKWFNAGVGAKYYEGGFEDTMTRREAALILGVRESSTAKRIKEAHRRLLILNHPDTGGSTYMAGKINEAKELLLKGKRR